MSSTKVADLTVTDVPFGSTPIGEPVLRLLERGEQPDDYPLLDLAGPAWPGDSPHLDRGRLTEALVQSNAAMGNALPEATVQALRGGGVLVITGQQPGLLGGPGYALLKALTVIGLAERLAEATGRPVLPAFWIAGEDHDVLEVNRATVGGATFVCDHPRSVIAGHRPPVAWLSVEPWRASMLDFLRRRLPDGPGREAMLAAAESADCSSYTAQFAHLLTAMVGAGRLVLVDPMRLRTALAPALADIVGRAEALHEGFERGSVRLREAGIEPQLDRLGLFELRAGERRPVALEASAAEKVRGEPEAYSPGAALRPIVQDAALPVLCTVGGPAELTYLWQIEPLYEAAGVARSVVWPRLSATVLDPGAAMRADAFGLDGVAVFDARQRFKAFDPGWYDDGPDETMAAIEAARDAWINRIEQLAGEGADRRIDRARDSARHQSAEVIRQVRLQRLERRGLGRGRMRELAETVLPGGLPQERVTSGLELAAHLGVDRLRALPRSIDVTRIAHRVIRIDNG